MGISTAPFLRYSSDISWDISQRNFFIDNNLNKQSLQELKLSLIVILKIDMVKFWLHVLQSKEKDQKILKMPVGNVWFWKPYKELVHWFFLFLWAHKPKLLFSFHCLPCSYSVECYSWIYTYFSCPRKCFFYCKNQKRWNSLSYIIKCTV